jgi:hypothetical protein
MEGFVRNEKIKRFRELRDRTTDPTDRDLILKLLAEEEAQNSWCSAETRCAGEQSRPDGVVSKDNKYWDVEHGILLVLITAGIAFCGIMIGAAWSFGLHQ